MAGAYVITGTGTDVGKTVAAAVLSARLAATYWKPVQTGVSGTQSGDTETVVALTGAPVIPPVITLPEPLSPHRAAELAGVTIDVAALTVPPQRPLVIEGAGGVLVPITRQLLSADLFARWGLPVVLVATTGLGTISATLTAIEALRARGVVLHGLLFNGPSNDDNIATIAQFSGARVLGRIPPLAPLTRASIREATNLLNPEDFP